MLSSLLRPKRAARQRRPSRSEPDQSYFNRNAPFRDQVDDARSLPQQGRQRPSDDYEEEDAVQSGEDRSDDDEEALEEATPLLPIFSAAHLDALPLYSITHSIRLMIVQKCETILTWEQLRSPQISQFLVKPIQQQIQASQWSRVTIYALIANCLQFNKEAQTNPGSSGFSKTRAMLAEMLAMRLLREFSTRELIDVLSYDFDPLQGVPPPPTARGGARSQKSAFAFSEYRPPIVRTSTIEVAIRSQAKRFLAHPLVIQHLEAVWRGTIVFHSAADNLHRYPSKPVLNVARHYGATHSVVETNRAREAGLRGQMIRRAVTLYDPTDASIFKLSRLRVPRYRQIFSTLSYMIMLGLFLAVLVERSLDITVLEVIFWFWSAGFMLDEIVGFSEQGFGLYIISVWNAFDVGILFMFFLYYVLRLYGIIIAANHKHHIADMAYDILASTAVLLFPRLFNFLDHYKYFSQLLIAFRMMFQDLIAILILMVITCSGFFVAFTLSFGQQQFGGALGTIYALFQIVMGFTPAAWAVWDQYNVLGQSLLVIFMIICHFLVVTILITVLTNSFMAVVKAADEEHQFLFAVNTISMVKSDALFSYIAPSNLIGWLFTPLRWMISFRQFVRVNRTIIKITHIPILLIIYVYEKIRLSRYAYEPTELIEQQGRRSTIIPFALNGPPDLFSPGTRMREPSITTYHKDRALEEVFRRPFEGDDTINKQQTETTTDQHSNVVAKWMSGIGDHGEASPPEEQPRSILERLERNRPPMRRAVTSYVKRKPWRSSSQSESARSDPDDHYKRSLRRKPQPINEEDEDPHDALHVTDRDADDELLTNAADDESVDPSTTGPAPQSGKENVREMHEEDLATPTESKPKAPPFQDFRPASASASAPSAWPKGPSAVPGNSTNGRSTPGGSARRDHQRNSSTTTILFKPQSSREDSSPPSPRRVLSSSGAAERPRTSRNESSRKVPAASRRSANIPIAAAPQASPRRPGLANRKSAAFQSAPNVARFLDLAARSDRRAPSFSALALDLASDIGDNRGVVLDDDDGPQLGSSFQEQLDRETARRQKQRSDAEGNQMSRLVLARMNTLEEGFKDMLREVKQLGSAMGSANASSRTGSANDTDISAGSARALKSARKTPASGARSAGGPLKVRVELPPGADVGGEAERKRSSGLREVVLVEDSPQELRSDAADTDAALGTGAGKNDGGAATASVTNNPA